MAKDQSGGGEERLRDADRSQSTILAAARDEFAEFEEQRLKVAAEEPVSTFSLDVDTASYAYTRRMLEDGYVPERDAVRIEELINYFRYDLPRPDSREAPFSVTTDSGTYSLSGTAAMMPPVMSSVPPEWPRPLPEIIGT